MRPARSTASIPYPAYRQSSFATEPPQQGDTRMKVMVLVKASRDSEAGVLPSAQLLEEMGKFNEELAKAGVLLAGEGLHPSSKGARVKFSGKERTVIQGPFAG